MQRDERDCLGTAITILIWGVILYAIVEVLALAICGICYVLWISILKPLFGAVDDWMQSRPPYTGPEINWDIVAVIAISLVWVPIGIYLLTMSWPLGLIVLVVLALLWRSALKPKRYR